MALITCPFCGKPVSDSAVQCPHCNKALNAQYSYSTQENENPKISLLKYGESTIPFILLLLGLLYLLVGFDTMYHDYNFFDCRVGNCINPYIDTPFSDDAFYIPLIATIIVPIIILISCRIALKQIEKRDSITVQRTGFSKKIALWIVIGYAVGFALVFAVHYGDYSKAKQEQIEYNTQESLRHHSEITNTNTIRY